VLKLRRPAVVLAILLAATTLLLMAATVASLALESPWHDLRTVLLAIGTLAGAQVLLVVGVAPALLGWQREQVRARERAEHLALELSDAKLAAEEASRTKGQFLANMSHELRTPFQGVLGMLQLLRNTQLSERQEELVRTAQDSASHLLGILNEILDLSALQSGKVSVHPAPVDLRQLCREVESLMRVQAEARGLVLQVDVAASVPPWVDADAKRIKQVLFNLVNNGIKFTPAGEVRLRLDAQPLDDGRHLVWFEVEDTGIGMDKATLARLFRRFETGDASLSRAMGGAGLGLEISRSLARLMGGDLRVASEPGKGSTFVLELPLAVAPAQLELALAEAPPAPRRRLRVLVADDHPVNRRYLGLVLESLEHQAVFCANGQEALELARAEPLDVVLMDIHMPVLDGLAATRALRAEGGRLAALPVIALSADVLAGSRERALDAGCDMFLIKPVQIEALATALEQVLRDEPVGAATAAAPANAPHGASLLSARFEEMAARLPRATLDELLGMFFADDARAIADLAQALAAADAAAVGPAAHKCKGSARLLGLDAIASACEAAEAWARGARPEAEPAVLATVLDCAVAETRRALAARQAPALAHPGVEPVAA
jgi:signal transduction histidine kinase/DNA-binding NarL/FixJ family response regulator